MCSMANVNTGKKIQSFTDLLAWREGRMPVLSIDRRTESFSVSEQFGSSDQIHRVAVPITSSIADGFSRSVGKEKAGFYYIALGSFTELQDQPLIARDAGYCNEDACAACSTRAIHTSNVLNGSIKTASNRLTNM